MIIVVHPAVAGGHAFTSPAAFRAALDFTMNLVNRTPHPITLRVARQATMDDSHTLPDLGAEAWEDIVIPPSGVVARIVVDSPAAPFTVAGIPVPVRGVPGDGRVEGLPPEPPDGTRPTVAYIVSGMVIAHHSLSGRRDVFAPGTGPNDGAIRNEAGHIVAVTMLVTAADAESWAIQDALDRR